MTKIFRPKDIDRMKASDISQDFADYFDRLSEERKQEFIESRPELYTALLAWGKAEEKAHNEESQEATSTNSFSVEEQQSKSNLNAVDDQGADQDLSAIMHNAYEHIDIPTLIKDDFRPVETLVIDDNRISCPAHRVPLKVYNPRFHKPNGEIMGIKFYHCPECNRLYIEKSQSEIKKQQLEEWGIPFTIYDYELTKKYLSTQVKPYALTQEERIYVPEQWVEENPKCPIHGSALENLPCVLKYCNRSISFDAYYCEQCNKVVLRRTHALRLEDQCAEVGIPLVEFEPLVKKTPSKRAIPKREIKPDFIMNEGKRAQYSFDHIADCYKLTEADTVIVSDSLYCTLDGHNTETVLGLIWVKERAGGSRKSYLFMLGYCSECQKYYMDESDYRTIYKIGRPEVTILLDVADDSYMITSGEVFDLENTHLCKLEDIIIREEKDIYSQPDYVSQYATMTGYDDGNLAYSKYVSNRKYEARLGELYGYKECPYQYRVDITADGKTEVYYIGSTDINLDHKTQVISANSKFGRELVHYQTIKVKKDGLEYSIKLSRQFDINQATLYGYTNLRTDEDIIFKSGITDPFLVRVLNIRKRQHNLIDIFVTIQENQNTIVDAPFEENLIVQGCAGSGKTMVLLHRLSSLKYNYPRFDFSQDALILTPNDHFTLHIKGLAESLQIGSINRASVEQYYQNVLEEYSKELLPSGTISSEMSVRQVFVDYIYSDDFRTSFEKNYSQKIALRNAYIEDLQILIELLDEKPRDIDVADDSKVIPQIRTALDWLKSKIDAAERKVNDTEVALKEALDRKERLSIEIRQKREYAVKVLRESAPRAKTKALAVLAEEQRTLDEKKKRLSILNLEKESLEQNIESSVENDNPLLPEYLSKNAEWIDPSIIEKIDSLSKACRDLQEKETRKNNLEDVLSIPYEVVIANQSSDDADIARLLVDLSNDSLILEQLMQKKSTIERECLEQNIESSVENDNPLLPEYLSKNAEWIDPSIKEKIDSLSKACRDLQEKETRKSNLEAVLSIPYEVIVANQSSDDGDIARLLADLSNDSLILEQLMQKKSTIENGWIFGRSRRLSDVNKQIDEAEKAIEGRKKAIIDVLSKRKNELMSIIDSIEQLNSELILKSKDIRDAVAQKKKSRLSDINKQIDEEKRAIGGRKAAIVDVLSKRRIELLSIIDSIEQLNSELILKSKDIRDAVAQKKKSRLTALKRQITMQSNSIESEQSLLNENVDAVYQMSDDMTIDEILRWLDRVCDFAPEANDERKLYSRLQKDVLQNEEAYFGMDEKIASAQEAFDTAQNNRYDEDIRKAIVDLQTDIVKYSALGTYQLIFDATVQPFKEKHKIKAISGKCHRYDLYARLLFAMKFYGRKPKQIKFMCVDEGQDLAANEYRLIYELNDHGVIFNIFGDVNQLIKTNRGISNWADIIKVFPADQYTLNENYRNTNQITRFCNDSFNMSMLQTGVDGAKVREITKKEFEQELSELQITTERVAVLLPRGVQKRKYFSPELLTGKNKRIMGEEIVGGKIAVMYVDEVKGIEFDKVYVIPNKMGRNEKYIAYTRALSELTVVIDETVPAYDDSNIPEEIS